MRKLITLLLLTFTLTYSAFADDCLFSVVECDGDFITWTDGNYSYKTFGLASFMFIYDDITNRFGEPISLDSYTPDFTSNFFFFALDRPFYAQWKYGPDGELYYVLYTMIITSGEIIGFTFDTGK